jgi:hypothetical protein
MQEASGSFDELDEMPYFVQYAIDRGCQNRRGTILGWSATWIMLPLLGALLNGTSSVLYGTVPEVTSPGQTEHAFALFYTGVIGSGALFAIAFGLLGDFVCTPFFGVCTERVARRLAR